MIKNSFILNILAFILLVGVSCSPKSTKSGVKTINPNGDSELTLLMRAMYNDAFQMKQQISNRKKPTSERDFEAILRASATDDYKVKDPQFQEYANRYLNIRKSLIKGSDADATEEYRGMIDSCLKCHRSFCPGPMGRIKKLYMD